MNRDNFSNKNSNRKWCFSYYEILCGFYMMHKLLPVVGEKMPSIVYMLIFSILFFMSLNRIVGKIGNICILKLLPIMSVSVLYLIKYLISLDFSGMGLYLYGELQMFLYGLIAITFVCSFDLYSQERFLKFLILCYIITSVTTIVGCNMYPNAARTLATAAVNNTEYLMYLSKNIGGFTFIYEITLLSPVVIYLIKSKKIGRILGTIILIIFGAAIVKSEYTTALIIYSISLVLYFVKNWDAKKTTLFLMIIITLIFSRSLLITAFSWLSVNINSEIISSRFNDIAAILNGVDVSELGSGGNRLRLYQQSWETFLSTNLFGSWNKGNIGGHSFILDNMGIYGIIGAVFLLISFASSWKYSIKPFKRADIYYYYVYVYILIIVMALINPKSNLYMFICILPLLGNICVQNELL